MDSTPRKQLRWSRILGYSTATAAALGLYLLPARSAAPPPATSPADLAATVVDINDEDTRYALTELGRRALERQHEMLYLRCAAGHADQFTAHDAAWGRAPYTQRVDLHRAGYAAIARRPRYPGAPPPIPPPVAMPAHPIELQPAPEVWTQDVSAEDWTDVEQMALALWRDGITPVRYRPRREDGSTLLLEFCWRGHYGLYLRADTDPANPGDARVIALADRIFRLGGGKTHSEK